LSHLLEIFGLSSIWHGKSEIINFIVPKFIFVIVMVNFIVPDSEYNLHSFSVDRAP